jgi:hypothetical protein
VKVDTQQIDLSPLHRLHGKDRASSDYPVTDLRQAAENSEDKTADSRCVFVGDIEAEMLVELADIRAA